MAGYTGIGHGVYKNTMPGSKRHGKRFRRYRDRHGFYLHDYGHGMKVYEQKARVRRKMLKIKAKQRKAANAYDPLKLQTGKTLDRELDAATKLKYGPQEAQLGSQTRDLGLQLGSQRRISDQAQRNIESWYNSYLGTVDQATQATQGAYAQAQQGVYGQANVASAQDAAANQQLQQQANQNAAQLGAVADPSVAVENQQANASRQALSSAFGSMIGGIGANQTAHMADTRRIGGLSKVGEHQNEAARRRQIESAGREQLKKINDLKSQLASEKGSYRVDLRRQLRSDERQYAALQQEFGLKSAQEGEKQRHSVAMERNVRRGQNIVSKDKRAQRKQQRKQFWAKVHRQDRTYRLNVAKFGATKAKDVYQRQHKLGPYKPPAPRRAAGGGIGAALTPTQARAKQLKYEQAVGLIRSRHISAHSPTTYETALLANPREWGPRLVRRLQAKYGHDVALKAVRRVLHTGGRTGHAIRRKSSGFGGF